MINDWLIDKLNAVHDERSILIRDPFHLIPAADGVIHRFSSEHGFTAITASTNLVFRELYERTIQSKDAKKILILDRAPARRRFINVSSKAPPPFYPDFLAITAENAIINIDLRRFLVETTGDSLWPETVNEIQYAKLISDKLESVLRAYNNLRIAHKSRFSDQDFQTIIAFSVLGIPDNAFKKIDAKVYWKIGLAGFQSLEKLDEATPVIADTVRKELKKASPPFCWFADQPVDTVVRAFYMSVIISQHFDNWKLLLANIDPELKQYKDIPSSVLSKDAPELISEDPKRAYLDIEMVENALDQDALSFLLIDEMKLFEPDQFVAAIQNEKYSNLIRSLALIAAIEHLLSSTAINSIHDELCRMLNGETVNNFIPFVKVYRTPGGKRIEEAYILALETMRIVSELESFINNLEVKKVSELTHEMFRTHWIKENFNKLEYYLSSLERIIFRDDFLPQSVNNLPDYFIEATQKIRDRYILLNKNTYRLLSVFNDYFQTLVHSSYKEWSSGDSGVLLTSHFLQKCLKPNWDSENENALVMVFDGMRYDIWVELVWPALQEYLELIREYPAFSLLPTETHFSRKAISAGGFPDSFDTRKSEDKLLEKGLANCLDYNTEVKVIKTDSSGTGETVRYKAAKLDYYIFELCDTELHNIKIKTLQGGRQVPNRPLVFIYNQIIKNIIDIEIVGIVKSLPPHTKVFIVADHGFGLVGRDRLFIEEEWLNEPVDCNYQNVFLKQTLEEASAPPKIRNNTLEFPIENLKLSAKEEINVKGNKHVKEYKSVLFPKTGYSLSRPGAKFRPDAYTHGGISIQEMLVPMFVLKTKSGEDEFITLDQISGSTTIVEGEEVEFSFSINKTEASINDIKLEVKASYLANEAIDHPLSQILYLIDRKTTATFRFTPDTNDSTVQERKEGFMRRTFRLEVVCKHGTIIVRKSREKEFIVKLNPDKIVRRVPSHLGKILGLTPRSMK